MLNQTIEIEGCLAEEELLRGAKVGELKAEIQHLQSHQEN